MSHSVESLIAFEQRVADAFAAKEIRAPVHLSSPAQADHLIRIFKDFRPGDWVCSNWRSHFHCLLAGMPEDELFDAIIAGRSMFICSKKYRIICSAIVGGILLIAAGLALGIKRNFGDEKVYCFVGDMTGYTGIYHESLMYCCRHELPVVITHEDNGLSTNTKTRDVWGWSGKPPEIHNYSYKRTWPHVGIGQHVEF